MYSAVRISIALVAISVLLFGGACILLPRAYDVPAFTPRKGTRFWKLPTGSQIGYLSIESTTESKRSPIVYVHGGPGGAVRDAHITALQPLASLGHDIYFYDQIGSGQSERLEDVTEYSVARHCADLNALLEQIKSPKVILIGHAWGAMLVVNYLQNYPTDRIEKIVFEVPGPILPIDLTIKDRLPDPRLGLTSPTATNRETNERTNNWRVRWVRAGAYRWGIKLGSDREMDRFMAYWDRELSRSTICFSKTDLPAQAGSGYYAHIMTVQSFEDVPDQRAVLAQLEIPVLVLKAQCDNQPWGYAAEYLELFKQSELGLVTHSGHDMATEQPELYLEFVAKFLSKSQKD